MKGSRVFVQTVIGIHLGIVTFDFVLLDKYLGRTSNYVTSTVLSVLVLGKLHCTWKVQQVKGRKTKTERYFNQIYDHI